MPLPITFELSDEDLAHFRKLMQEARAAASDMSQSDIVNAGRALLEQANASRPPAYVNERLEKLAVMIEMLDDEQWQLPPIERARVLNALAYFSEPCDLIADTVVGLGFLDDAIMIQLVVDELQHEIEAYEDFRGFVEEERGRRESDGAEAGKPITRKDWLDSKRDELQGRMRKRSGALSGFFSLFNNQ